MAIFTFSPLIVDIAGSIGNITLGLSGGCYSMSGSRITHNDGYDSGVTDEDMDAEYTKFSDNNYTNWAGLSSSYYDGLPSQAHYDWETCARANSPNGSKLHNGITPKK